MKKNLLFLFCTVIFWSLGSNIADAASFFMLPKSAGFNIGEEFNLDLKINATDEFLNAGQAKVNFPPDILELVSVDKSASTFNFWVEEPVISNEIGTLVFTGGTARGVSGPSLQVIKMKFKTKGAGVATVSISDAVITASDGKGTNILNSIEEASFRIGTKVVKSEIPSQDSIPKISPQILNRVAVLATKSPSAPIIQVPFYSDSSIWYNRQGETIALWDVPEDVTSVAVSLDKKPDTVPEKAEPELSTGKSLGVLSEGVWYVHVQFKNNIGWGKVSHYRIMIDTTAPKSFDAYIDSEISDNPTPTVKFDTADSLSGILIYSIYVDKEKIGDTEKSSFVLPPQSPGKHTLRVRAFDKAGNSTESLSEIEILPLEQPVVNFFTDTISQSENLFVSGTAIPESGVIFKIRDAKKREILSGVVHSDKAGKWELRTVESFKSGNYYFTLITVDERGAQSFPTEENKFRVRALTLFSVGSIDVGWFEIFLSFILIILILVLWVLWYQKNKNDVRGAYSTIIARDVVKFCDMFDGELSGMKNRISTNKKESELKTVCLEINFRIEKMTQIVSKMRQYLGQEVNKLKK